MTDAHPASGWQFWVDRGGTFTDIVARQPNGRLNTHKLLSENPECYDDAVLHGIRQLLAVPADTPLPSSLIDSVKMGTTVATNALLERKGEQTLLVTTRGFGDALRIGYQNRPAIFARQILLPEPLYSRVLEVEERLDAGGEVVQPLTVERYRQYLQQARRAGFNAIAIVFMHAYRNPAHELAFGQLAAEVGFSQVTLSHQASPLIKLVGRGDTAVVDAYVNPVLRNYVDRVHGALPDTELMFMQSSGGLAFAGQFQGRHAILSGPAGGVVGGVKTSLQVGCERLVGFDMGGTSTDVWHYNGDYERVLDAQVAGVRLRVPMMHIHTVAAGGGSVCTFDGGKLRVGPESAGANPGPACYRRGGPLAITDCNLLLGKLLPDHFPAVFGPGADQPLSITAARQRAEAIVAEIRQQSGVLMTVEQAAEGFIRIAVQNMADAIKTISTQRGYDVSRYALCSFGGAGGQHACRVAEALGVATILIHPLAGVLSAYGIGLADTIAMREQTIEAALAEDLLPGLVERYQRLYGEAERELLSGKPAAVDIWVKRRANLKYRGADTSLAVEFAGLEAMREAFELAHRQRFGFLLRDKPVVVDSIVLEAGFAGESLPVSVSVPVPEEGDRQHARAKPSATPGPESTRLYMAGEWREVRVWQRPTLVEGDSIAGPAVIVEQTGTTVVEPGWQGRVLAGGHLQLDRIAGEGVSHRIDAGADAGFEPDISFKTDISFKKSPDPILLEIFNSQFMSVAEQMGAVLANSAHSVNIKERLDFSCAIFNSDGELVANAPHVPVHLGSMGATVRALIDNPEIRMQPGDAWLVNSPYAGGTHLPDMTVVTAVFDPAMKDHDPNGTPLFFVASRAHHADIGGITPGSIPPHSHHIDQEGVLISAFQLVAAGEFRGEQLQALLTGNPHPVRNLAQNIADLQAQIAANTRGVRELSRVCADYGTAVVEAYMEHVQNNAEACVRRAISCLGSGSFVTEMDDGAVIRVAVSVDREAGSAVIDFAGTSSQRNNNFNAPSAVCRAAVLYVFRMLVDEDIPLNAGCLKPLDIRIPEGSMLNPLPPAAVVAGNVETSQYVVDCLCGALDILACSQGTMNNLTFGNERYQYYETICGGAGAGPGFDGASAVQVHMTNSRLTDPEVLELRYPVRVDSFAIRRGSGGAGRWHGGDGVVRKLRFLDTMTAAMVSGHRRVAPFGLNGGLSGRCGNNSLVRASGESVALEAVMAVDVQAGDVLVIETPGGGGWGEPESAGRTGAHHQGAGQTDNPAPTPAPQKDQR